MGDDATTTSGSRFAAAAQAALAEAGARHAHFDAKLFAALCDGPARRLWAAVATDPTADAVLAAYLSLLREAVALGYVRAVHPPSSFLGCCLLEAVPTRLHDVRPAERVARLAQAWNLGEGLLREPAWLDRYVASRAAELRGLHELPAFLARVLEPALEPGPPARWGGPFRVTVLDLRPAVDDLLPGPMHLAAPAVLAVRDRGRPDVWASVLLRRHGQSQVLGASAALPAYESPDAGQTPRPEFERDRVRIGAAAVELPFLAEVESHAVAPAGFVIAAASDSQRLWIMESP
jgi:hypothetical protein